MKTYDELKPSAKKFVDSYFTNANFPKLDNDPRKWMYSVDRYGRVSGRHDLPE